MTRLGIGRRALARSVKAWRRPADAAGLLLGIGRPALEGLARSG